MRGVLGLDNERLWSEKDCEYRVSEENLFGQDRSKMNVAWSGLSGLVPEDASIGVSMGPIVERRKEMLVASRRRGGSLAVHRLLRALVRRHEAGLDHFPDSTSRTIRRCAVSRTPTYRLAIVGRTCCRTTFHYQRSADLLSLTFSPPESGYAM